MPRSASRPTNVTAPARDAEPADSARLGLSPRAAGVELAIIGEHGFLIHAMAVMLAHEGGYAVSELERPWAEAGHALRRAATPAALVGLTQMGPADAIAEVAALRMAAPGTALLAILRTPDPVLARDVLRAGARGCITRRASAGELFDAIRRVLAGEQYVSPPLALALAGLVEDAESPMGLTVREKEVLRLIGLGLTNVEIGRVLHLSVRTVESHRAHLQRKLGTMRRADLVRHAAALGLLG